MKSSKIYDLTNDGLFMIAEVKYHKLSEFSMWDCLLEPKKIIAGNVNGDLLSIDKTTLTVSKEIHLHKKNLRSLYAKENWIYSGAQDLCLKILDSKTLNTISEIKKCHRKMFAIVGVTDHYIITTSPPCGETKLWNRNDLTLHETIPISSWNMFMIEDKLIYSNKDGIYEVNL